MNFISRELVIDFPVGGVVSVAIREALISNRAKEVNTRVHIMSFFIENLQIMITLSI
jgi:hypothetical protein